MKLCLTEYVAKQWKQWVYHHSLGELCIFRKWKESTTATDFLVIPYRKPAWCFDYIVTGMHAANFVDINYYGIMPHIKLMIQQLFLAILRLC